MSKNKPINRSKSAKNKKELAFIKYFADNMLPLVMRNTQEVHIMKGRELKQLNYPDAEKYGDDEIVRFNYPVQIYMNHYNAIKDIWYGGGTDRQRYDGINDYLQNVANGMKKTRQADEKSATHL